MELKLDLMREMYQSLAIAERINYMILEEKYEQELHGYNYVNEGIGDSIKEGFEKFINTVKNIIKKIIHFVTVTIPGAIKKFFNTIISIFKKKEDNVVILSGKLTTGKLKALAGKSNKLQKLQNTMAAATTVAAVGAEVKKDKPSSSEDAVVSTDNRKSDLEKIKELRKRIDMEKQDFKKIMEESLEECAKIASPAEKQRFMKALTELEKAANQGKIVQVVEEGEKPKKLVGYKGIMYDEKLLNNGMVDIRSCNSWFDSAITDCFARVTKGEGFNSYSRVVDDWKNISNRARNDIEKINRTKYVRTVNPKEFENVKSYLPELDKAIKSLSGSVSKLQKSVDKLTLEQWKQTTAVPKVVNSLLSMANSVVSLSSNFSMEVSKTLIAFSANSTPVYE